MEAACRLPCPSAKSAATVLPSLPRGNGDSVQALDDETADALPVCLSAQAHLSRCSAIAALRRLARPKHLSRSITELSSTSKFAQPKPSQSNYLYPMTNPDAPMPMLPLVWPETSPLTM